MGAIRTMPDMRRKRRRAGRPWQRLRRAVLARAGWRCEQCGGTGRFEVHHVRPLHEGGTDDMANLIALCRRCHLSHHTSTSVQRREWLERVNATV